MIANEGYTPLSLIYSMHENELFDGAREYLLGTSDSHLSLLGKRIEDVTARWLFAYWRHELFLVDGRSAPVKLDPFAILQSWIHVEMIYEMVPNFDKLISAQLRESFGFSPSIFGPGTRIEYPSDLDQADPRNFDDLLLHNIETQGQVQPKIFLEHSNFQLSFELYDALLRIPNSPLDKFDPSMARVADKLRPYAGWFLAVKSDFDQEQWRKYCTSISQKSIKQYVVDRTHPDEREVAKGRPRKQELAARTYLNLFPEGHGTLTWTLVEDQIKRETGQSISSQTIRAAIKRR